VQLASKYRFSDPAIRKQRDWDVSTDTLLHYILTRLASWEAKWLVRLILREYCTIELDENFVLGQYHFLLPDLLKFQNDFNSAIQLLKTDLNCYPPAPNPASECAMRIEAGKLLKAVVGIKVGRPSFYKAWVRVF
jgi:DNA ligase 4